ncbi:hypothetical protein [Micromonospora sp. MW-13]|uniref:hypothetical protein n=1 Tax=Micromonospora sp. MW-13 TaxID=2094022 RepID=UPI001404C84B|nr:hypothetical protein [Micromonospora sp. MW-13]
MTRVLLVPGRNEPLPGRWQEWLRGRDPERPRPPDRPLVGRSDDAASGTVTQHRTA